MNDTSQYPLNNPPSDGISEVCFSPYDNDILLVASWDGTLRLYNVENNKLLETFENTHAILTCCFGEKDKVYYGGLDNEVYQIDLVTKDKRSVGKHDKPVRSVCYSLPTNKLYSGSWDKTLCVWDTVSMKLVERIELQHKVFSMDLQNDKLAIAMSEQKTHVYDIRDMSQPWQVRETSLRYMSKCIRLMPNGQGFALSSIEGRVAIEYFDMSPEVQAKKYAFKSHRQTVQDTEVVYPVNALAFHPKYGTFASGGSDCVVNTWDGINRKRIRHIVGYPENISSLCFNKDGTLLAIASSYTFDEGERPHESDAIFIKRVVDTDVAPRIASSSSRS